MRFTIVAAIVGKELKEALRNRTLLLVICLPLIASLGFRWLQSEGVAPLKVGVPAAHLGLFTRFLPPDMVSVYTYTGDEPRDTWLHQRTRWDAIIETEPDFAEALAEGRLTRVRVTVHPKLGPTGRFVAAQLPMLLQMVGTQPLIQVEVEGLTSGPGHGSSADSFLAIWMTVTAVMIGIMVMGGNLAEERERGTLLALVTTPAHMHEIVAAKGLFGTLITVAMGVFMLLMHSVSPPSTATALLVLAPGALGFTAIGLLIGFLAPNQATARSYGTLIYLPLLVPVFAHDASTLLARWSPLIPSYHLWAGLDASLRTQGLGPSGLDHAAWLAGFSLVMGWVLMAVMARRRF